MPKKIEFRKWIIILIVITVLIIISLLIPKWSKLNCYNSKGSVCYGSSEETKYKSFWACKNSKPLNNNSGGILEWLMKYSRCGLGCKTEDNIAKEIVGAKIKCLIIFDNN